MSEEQKEIQTTIEGQEESSSYRSIFKATSLFGGVQVYQILMDVIRSKFVALLLGPLGVGIQGLYTSATDLIQQLTSFGLSSSAVRNVAEANAAGDRVWIARVVYTLRKLIWITGLLGTVVVIVFAPILSKSSFGDTSHVIPFIIISVTLLLTQLTAGQKVLLQGTRRLKLLAKSSALGATFSLFVSIPLYYLWGVKGIVPNIVIMAVVTYVINWYYARQIHVDKVSMPAKEVLNTGRAMIILGIASSFSHLAASVSAYAIRACVRFWGGVEIVGLYMAGYILMTHYTGLVFKAMGTDFYPRLASVNKDNIQCRKLMNQQGEIGLLLLAPLLVVCIVFVPLLIRILYSEEFLAVETYIVWCSLGMLFKMASWAIAYVFLAKGEAKTYIVNEITAAVYTLILNLLGFKLAGLTGLGISFVLSYIIYLVQVYIISNKKYSFSFERSFVSVFLIQFFVVLVGIMIVVLLPSLWRYILGTVLVAVSTWYSLYGLNKRVGLRKAISNKLKRKK